MNSGSEFCFEDSSHLGCGIASVGESFPMFGRIVVPTSSGWGTPRFESLTTLM